VLAQAWQALGGDPALLPLVTTVGSPGLASPLDVGGLAVGAVGAQLLAAAELRADGAAPEPVLDARHVGLAFRSERFVRLDGAPAGVGFAPLSRFLPAADGWVRLHANYPHHRRAVDRALGPDPLAAVAERAALDVEDAVVAAGGVAAVVRSPEQWARHPQGAAVRDLPLLRLRQVGPAPARDRRLPGLRVLDLTRVIAGPVGTRTLAAHGADVLRVDSPALPEDPAALLDTGPGKRHCLLDLRGRADRARFDELLTGADVLVQGYRPGALSAHGLAPDALAERFPGLVVVTLSAWGAAGPWARRRGFDSIVQAASGIAAVSAGPDGGPGALPAQALDHGAGHLVAATVLRAVTESRRQGGTWHGELSLAQVAGWLLAAPRPAEDPASGTAVSSRGAPGPASGTAVSSRGAPGWASGTAVSSRGALEDGLADYLVDLPSPSGVVTLVRPPGAPVWTRGPVPAGYDSPQWPAR
jgi:crotonobetainyl-CoA:carnitine CoA-transferase CaiB-like acyl-CoA transferase